MANRMPWPQMDREDPRLGDAIQSDAAMMESQRQDLRAKYVIWESFVRGEMVSDLHFSMTRSSGVWNPGVFNAFGGTPSLNVMGVVVETLQSMLFSLQPFVTYDTSGATKHTDRMIGRKKTNFVDGVWYQSKLYRQTSMCGRDAAVFGTGIIKGSVPNRKTNEIVLERVHPDGALFDARDAAKGKPRRFIHRDFLQKEVAKFHFPKFEREIDKAATVYGFLSPTAEYDDYCTILDAYWVSPDPREPGVHAMVIGNTVVSWEPWELRSLPVRWMAYNEVSSGILGKGVAQDLMELQVALDDNERNISDGVRKMAHGKILVSLMADLTDEDFDDENGTIIRYTGNTPPEFISPQAMSPEVYQRSQTIIASMFARAGVSELMSQGRKPAGLDSAPAQREYAEQASTRFLDLGSRYENFHVDIADLTCELAGLYSAKARTQLGKIVKYDEVTGYGNGLWRAYPVSKLPHQPAARKAQIEEDFQKGFMSREDYLRLRQYPDTESWINDEVAPRELIESQLDDIMSSSTYQAPNPYQDNATALDCAIKRHNRAVLDEESDGVIGLLERYIDQSKKNLENQVAAKQQMAALAQPVQALVPQAAMPPQ